MKLSDSNSSGLNATAPGRPVALVRIVVGLLAAWRGLIATGDVIAITASDHLRVPFDWWPLEATRPLSLLILGVWITTAVLFAAGWRTQVVGLLLSGSMAATLLSDQQLYANHFYLLILVVFLLTVAGSGTVLSVDATRGRSQEVPAWGVLLLKSQLTVVYTFAALTKMTEGFLSGEVLAAQLGTGWVGVPDALVTPAWMRTLAVATIAVELALAWGLWSRRWRPVVIPLGLGLHLGIVLFIVPWDRLAIFGATMLAGYLLFLDASPGSRRVFFDRSCGFCARWVRFFRRIDWMNVFEFIPADEGDRLAASEVSPDDADQAIQLVGSGDRLSGFDAVRRLFELTPVGYLWAPLGRLPGIRHVGGNLYDRVAARRKCPARQPAPSHSSQRP